MRGTAQSLAMSFFVLISMRDIKIAKWERTKIIRAWCHIGDGIKGYKGQCFNIRVG